MNSVFCQTTTTLEVTAIEVACFLSDLLVIYFVIIKMHSHNFLRVKTEPLLNVIIHHRRCLSDVTARAVPCSPSSMLQGGLVFKVWVVVVKT